MRILIIDLFISVSTSTFAQKHLLDAEIGFSTISLAASYEGFISDHFSLGAKLGFVTLGAERNYYLKSIANDQWNAHVGLGYELTAAWPITAAIWGPTVMVGVEHIFNGGLLIGLEGGVMFATYGDTADYNRNQLYPMINLRLGRIF